MNRFTYGLFSIILIGFLLFGCLQTAAKKIGSEDKNVTNPVKKLIETTEDIIGKVVKNETAAGTPEKITKTETRDAIVFISVLQQIKVVILF